LRACQEVHFEGRLERRCDEGVVTAWEPCACQLHDGEFTYAPAIRGGGGGGYTTGSPSSRTVRSGGSGDQLGRGGSSSGGGLGGGCVPLESAVAVRTVTFFFPFFKYK
jgi:hypothetical protein